MREIVAVSLDSSDSVEQPTIESTNKSKIKPKWVLENKSWLLQSYIKHKTFTLHINYKRSTPQSYTYPSEYHHAPEKEFDQLDTIQYKNKSEKECYDLFWQWRAEEGLIYSEPIGTVHEMYYS